MATYTGAGGIFTLGGRFIDWFYALEGMRDGSAFSSGSSIHKGIDKLAEEAQSALTASIAARDAVAKVTDMRTTQRAGIEQYKAACKAAWETLLKGFIRGDINRGDASVASLMAALRDQMSADSATVLANSVTIGSVSALGSNIGSALIYTYIQDASGVTSQLVRADAHTIICDQDQKDGAKGGRERLKLTSETVSRAVTFYPIYSAGTARGHNRLTNPDFESALSTGWSVAAGTSAHTIVTTTAAAVIVGTQGLMISADGSTATYKVQQVIGSSTATNPLLPGDRGIYSVAGHLDGDWTDGAATLRIKLVGTGYSTAIASLATAPGSLTHYQKFIALPRNYPADLKFVVEFTSTPAASVHAFVDNLAIGRATEVRQGVYLAAHRGGADFRVGDRYDFATTNNRVSRAQNFATEEYGVVFPSATSGAATIANSLFR